MSGKSLKIGIAAIAILLMTVAAVSAVSAATISVKAPQQVTAGQTFNVTVSISGVTLSSVKAVTFQLNYNPNLVQLVSYSTVSGTFIIRQNSSLNVLIIGSPTSSTLLTATFRAISSGTAQFTLSDATVNGNYNVTTVNATTVVVVHPAVLTVVAPSKVYSGQEFNVSIYLSNISTQDVEAVTFQLNYNPGKVHLILYDAVPGANILLSNNSIDFLLLTTPVTSKLLNVTFEVENTTGLTNFTLSFATVNGINAICNNATVIISSSWIAPYIGSNGKVTFTGVVKAIHDWMNNKLTMNQIVKIISYWLKGTKVM